MPAPSRHNIMSTISQLLAASSLSLSIPALAKAPGALKTEVATAIDGEAKLVQEMVDSVFSFAEPGFQEVKTSAYLTAILERNGFNVTRGVAGIPTAWPATWGTGGPRTLTGCLDCPRHLVRRSSSRWLQAHRDMAKGIIRVCRSSSPPPSPPRM